MPEVVPQERNLEENPFFLMNKRGTRKVPEVKFRKTVATEDGELDQFWQPHASGNIGMPGPVDQDVNVATNVRLHRAGGFTQDYDLDLSIYEIVKLLDWQDGKENYRYIRECLTRIGRTAIENRNAFYSKRKQTYVTDNINLWTSHFRRYQDIRGGGAAERHHLSFSKHYARSFIDGYVSYLDVDYYFSLRRAGAKRLLRLINALAYGSSHWEVELAELRDRVPLWGGYTAPSQLEQKLEPHHEELYATGYLLDFSFERRDGGVFGVYRLNPRFVQIREDLALQADPANRPALQMMAAADIPLKIRLRELRKHGPTRCYEVAELLPYQRDVRNPVKLFVHTCEHGVPDWWRSVAGDRAEVPAGPSSQDPQDPPSRVPEAEASDEGSDTGWDLFSGDRDPDPPQEPPEPNADALPIWEAALESIAEEINTPSFNVWFEGTIPVRLETDCLTIVVPNSFAKEYIGERFRETIQTTLSRQLDQAMNLQVVTLDEWQDVTFTSSKSATFISTSDTSDHTAKPPREGR